MFRRLMPIALTLVFVWFIPRTAQAQTPAETFPTARDIAYCAEVGALAASTARARDGGVPLTQLLAIKPKPGTPVALIKLMNTIQFDVYKHSWWSPSYARQQWELPCLSPRLDADNTQRY